MPYIPTDWKNLPSTETPINAENLNKIEKYLEKLGAKNVSNIDFTAEGKGGIGSGVLYRMGNTCQLTATVMLSGEFKDIEIGTLPNGFKGVMDTVRALCVVDGASSVNGYIRYEYSTNKIFLTTDSTESVVAKFSSTYLTEDEFML